MKHSPKHSPEIEGSVLNSCLTAYELHGHTIDLLTADDFYDPWNRRLFEAIQKRHRTNAPVDTNMVYADFHGSEQDLRKLEQVQSHLPMFNRQDEYIRELQDLKAHRAICKALLELLVMANDPSRGARDLATEAPKLLSAALLLVPQQAAIETLSDLCAQLGRELIDGVEERVVPTGVAELDALLTGGGFGASHLIVLGGRPGSGKSAEVANFAYHAAERGTPTLFVSLEMTNLEQARRIVQSRATQPIRNPEYFAGMLGRVHDANLPLDFWAPPTLTPGELRAVCQRAAVKQPYGFIVVDYLQLMQADGRFQRSRYETVSEISRAMKQLAMELQIPVLAVAQLNRNAGEFDAPQISDLRDSGQIEQDANTILLLHRLSDEHPRVHLRVAKQRNGRLGLVRQEFERDLMQFHAWDGTEDPSSRSKNKPNPFGGAV